MSWSKDFATDIYWSEPGVVLPASEEWEAGGVMKKEEWERRIPLDIDGIQLLGAALYLGLCQSRDRARAYYDERVKAEKSGKPIDERDWPYSLEDYSGRFRNLADQCREFKMSLAILAIPDDTYTKAKGLRAKDFQFRWDHLKKHKLLVGYITDDQPYISAYWDRETPISERWGDGLTKALDDIFKSELKRLRDPSADEVPLLWDKEDKLFYLTVWKLCEPDSGRGQPKGRRWEDGLENAASYAYSIYTDADCSDAEQREKPITIEDAIRRALKKFKVMGSVEFENYPDKRSAIVSDAGDKDGRTGTGRIEGAIKAVRKRLVEIIQHEKKMRLGKQPQG